MFFPVCLPPLLCTSLKQWLYELISRSCSSLLPEFITSRIQELFTYRLLRSKEKKSESRVCISTKRMRLPKWMISDVNVKRFFLCPFFSDHSFAHEGFILLCHESFSSHSDSVFRNRVPVYHICCTYTVSISRSFLFLEPDCLLNGCWYFSWER
jgi:hypothetical protein